MSSGDRSLHINTYWKALTNNVNCRFKHTISDKVSCFSQLYRSDKRPGFWKSVTAGSNPERDQILYTYGALTIKVTLKSEYVILMVTTPFTRGKAFCQGTFVEIYRVVGTWCKLWCDRELSSSENN